MNEAVILSGISHRHTGDNSDALQGIDLTLKKGEILSLIGPSGAGKSTLLSLLDGQITGWEGAAVVLGNAMNATYAPKQNQRADVGFIFQDFALVDRATVRQNVLNGRLGRAKGIAAILGLFSDADRDAANAALQETGIADLADKRADQLSGGQRQRVAIARCLAQEPKLILADEPVSNLDPVRAESILRLITSQAAKHNVSVIFTSHQPELAIRFSDRVVGIEDGCILFDEPAASVTQDQIAKLYATTNAADRLQLVI